MSEMPEIGSKISLISKADIRYEGNLFTVNPTECTIALANVRSFGTEDREVENVVPAHSGTYEFIMFRGSDIKDIKVVNNQMPMNDPAIVDYTGGPSSMKAPGYHHQPQLHHQDSYNPMMGGGGVIPMTSSHGGLYNPMSSMAPGMGRTIMKPQQLHQQQRAILDLISGGGGSRSSTPGLLGGSRKSPTLDQGIQVSGGHKGVSFGGSQHIKDDAAAANKRANNRDGGNRNRGGGSGAIGDHGYNKSRGGGRGGNNSGGGGGGFGGGGGGDNKDYRQQRRETFSINHIRPGMQDQQGGGGQQMRQQNSHPGQQHQQQQRGGWGGGNRGGNAGYQQGGGGFNNGGGPNQGQANRQRGRGGGGGGGGGRSQQGAANFNRAPGQQLQPGSNAQKNKLKFESDYDFDKANNEFEELRSQIAKVKIGDGDAATTAADTVVAASKVNGESVGAAADSSSLKKDDSETAALGGGDQEHEEGGGGGEESAPIYYDKAKSFFDNISCEAVERSKGRSQRTDWRTERKLNSETFGVASARRGNFRGRGLYYGGGRGGNQGGGYHRGGGGGGYHQRMNFNQNWQRNNYNNRAAHQHHNNATAVAAGSGDTA